MDINLPVYPIPRSFATSSDSSAAISTGFVAECPTKVISSVPISLTQSPLCSPLPPLFITGSKEDHQNLKDSTFHSLLTTVPIAESTANNRDHSLSDNGLKVSKAEANHSNAVVMRQPSEFSSVPPPQVNVVKNEQVDTLKTNENRFTCGSPFAPLLDLKRDVRPMPPDADAPEREREKKREHRKQHLPPAGSATAVLVPVTQLPSGVIASLRDMRELQTQAVSQLREHIPNPNQNLLFHPQFVAAASHQQQYTRVSIPLYYTHPIAHEAASEAGLYSAPLVRHASQRAFGESQHNQGDHSMFMAHHLLPRPAPFDSVIQTNAQALLQAQQQQEVQHTRHAPAPRSQPSPSQPYYPVLIQATREQSQHRTDLQPLLVTRHTSTSHTPEPVSHHVVQITRHSCEGFLSPNPPHYVQLQQLMLPAREHHSRVPMKQPSIELAMSSSASQTHVVYCHQPAALLTPEPEPQLIPQIAQLSQLESANPYNVVRQQVDAANAIEGDARSGRSRSHTRSTQRTSASSTSVVASMPSSRQSHRRRGNSTDDSGPPSVPAFIAISVFLLLIRTS